MPALYTSIRDDCIERKRKKKGKVTENDIKACKRMASILYFKKTGKTVKETHSETAKADEVDFTQEELEKMLDYFDVFGSLNGHGEET